MAPLPTTVPGWTSCTTDQNPYLTRRVFARSAYLIPKYLWAKEITHFPPALSLSPLRRSASTALARSRSRCACLTAASFARRVPVRLVANRPNDVADNFHRADHRSELAYRFKARSRG